MQTPKMPAIYISKYNRFVDNIIGRINKILGKSYDPVRVKILANDAKKNKKTATKKTTKKNKKRTNSKRRTAATNSMTNKMAEIAIARSDNGDNEPSYILISKTSDRTPELRNNIRTGNRATNNKNKKKNNNNNNKNGNKTKSGTKNKTPKAKATLFGLSSIRRDGDVSVNMMANHTTVKTNFVLGPLTLRVEREVIVPTAKIKSLNCLCRWGEVPRGK